MIEKKTGDTAKIDEQWGSLNTEYVCGTNVGQSGNWLSYLDVGQENDYRQFRQDSLDGNHIVHHIHNNCGHFMELVSYAWRLGRYCTHTQKHRELHRTPVAPNYFASMSNCPAVVFRKRHIKALET